MYFYMFSKYLIFLHKKSQIVYISSMYVEKVPNRNSPPTILLREGWREGNKIRKRTIANLSSWPAYKVEMLRRLLRGDILVPVGEGFQIVRSLPHGHVAAALGTLRRVGLEKLIASKASWRRQLVVAMIVARLIASTGKLDTAKEFAEQIASSSLGQLLGIETADENDFYVAMDWLLKRQAAIEKKLAQRHLNEATLVLYVIRSTYFEGPLHPLAKLEHTRNGRKGKVQIVFGLLCNKQGCPVAVELFEGSKEVPKILASQVEKIKDRFGVKRVVFVEDPGLLTDVRIRKELRPVQGLDWITELRAPQIRSLARKRIIQPSLFNKENLAEIRSPHYPGEVLIACRHPFLAEQRRRKRQELLEAAEKDLDLVMKATLREKRRLQGSDKIRLRVRTVLNRYKVGKYFRVSISEKAFRYELNDEKVAVEAALDGIYVIRTSVPHTIFNAQQIIGAYQGLSVVKRAFQSIKGIELKGRPIIHYLTARVRAHAFLCMLAYYVEWHMRQALAPILFDDDLDLEAKALWAPVESPPRRSRKAAQEEATKHTEEGLPVHSLSSLLRDLGTITLNKVMIAGQCFEQITTPTPLQKRAFDLLQIPLQ